MKLANLLAQIAGSACAVIIGVVGASGHLPGIPQAVDLSLISLGLAGLHVKGVALAAANQG